MTRRQVFFAIGSGLLVLGAAISPRLMRAAHPPALPAAPGGTAIKPLKVSGVVVQPTVFAETLAVTGTVHATEAVEIQAEAAGKITGIYFEEGTLVRSGDLLARINDAELRAELKRAMHRRDLAQIRVRRVTALLDQGGANQQDHDVAANELQVLTAETELIQAQLAKTEIRAPFAGIIGLRQVSVGAQVSTATRLATLQNLTEVKLDFAVPEKYAPLVATGRRVTFSVAGATDAHEAEIYAVEPRINEQTRTLTVRARAANPAAQLRSGAFAEIRLPLAPQANALLVPPVAVVPGLTEKNLYVARDGVAVRRPVEIGLRTATRVQVLSGLEPGETVITSGIQSLRPGLPVEIVPLSE